MNTPPSTWQTHPARWAVVSVGVGLCCLALVAGRIDLLLIGAPLVVLGLWTTRTPAVTEQLRLTSTADAVQVRSGGGAAGRRVRVSSPGHRPATVLIGGKSSVDFGLHSVRTGPRPEVRVDCDSHSPFWMSYTSAVHDTSDPLVVLPTYIPLQPVPEAKQVRGLTGPTTTRRPGSGFEFREVHPMTPADSTHRIDWRVSARQPSEDSWWVRGTYGVGEAIAVLIIDSRDEVGPDLDTWSGWVPLRVDEPTSLDLARHAAASIARRLIESGNRVGLADLATGRRLLTPAAGRRHLNRLTYALALTAPLGTPRRRVRPPQVPTDSLVYLFTTLLDDEPLRLIRALTSSGHKVVVVDTLPKVRPAAEVNLELAWRVTAAERQARIRRLTQSHVPVVAWSGEARTKAAAHLSTIRRTWSRPGVKL